MSAQPVQDPAEPCPHCGGTTFEQCLATPSCTGPQPIDGERP